MARRVQWASHFDRQQRAKRAQNCNVTLRHLYFDALTELRFTSRQSHDTPGQSRHRNDLTWFIRAIAWYLECPRNAHRFEPVSTSTYSPWIPRQVCSTRPRPHTFVRSSSSSVCAACFSVSIRWSGPPQQGLSFSQMQQRLVIVDLE